MGRPTECPKDKLLQVRLDDETLEKLDKCVKVENKSRSQVVRESISDRYEKIKK